MDSQRIWSKSEEKWVDYLVLRGHQLHRLKVAGSLMTIKRKSLRAREGLEQGEDPSTLGAKWVETLDARTIRKAVVSPDKFYLFLHGGPDGVQTMKYATADEDADQIFEAIREVSGRTYQSTEEEIGLVEALIPPAFLGAFFGLLWMGFYQSALKIAQGEPVDAQGRRRRAQEFLVSLARMLGTNGTIAVGVVLLVLVLGMAALRIVHRPMRTVWLAEGS